MIKCPDCKELISESEPMPSEVEDGIRWYQCPHCGADVRKEEIRHECDSQCADLVYERDTGLSWCRIDEEPETCQPYSRQDANSDAKNRWNERY